MRRARNRRRPALLPALLLVFACGGEEDAARCKSGFDCPPAFECVPSAGVCVRMTNPLHGIDAGPEPDAGPDASAPDAPLDAPVD